MRKSSTILGSLFIAASVLTASQAAYAQEYDDMYFRKSDREKLEAQNKTPGYPEPHETIAMSSEEENITVEEVYDTYDEASPDVIVKHYYYNTPSSRYYHDFDPFFWDSPYLYQGNMYDPYYQHYHPTRYYRPGWNVAFSVGFGSSWGRSRWNYRMGWGWPYYNSGSYWGYYSQGYYNGYYNNNHYFRENNSRGVIRGRRSSRGSIINKDNNGTPNGRVVRPHYGDDFGGKIEQGGRKNNSRINTTSPTNRPKSNGVRPGRQPKINYGRPSSKGNSSNSSRQGKVGRSKSYSSGSSGSSGRSKSSSSKSGRRKRD